jgi:chromosome segregation ATPase
MDISEIKKIVLDGLNRHKAFQDASNAIDQLEALAQYKGDLERKIAALKIEADKLANENGGNSEKLALKEAALKERHEKAENIARDIIERAHEEAARKSEATTIAVKKANDELNALKSEKAAIEQKKLDLRMELNSLESALAAAREKLRQIMG